MDTQEYLRICRAAYEVERARLAREVAALQLQLAELRVRAADARFGSEMERAELDPARPYRFDDTTLAIEPVEPSTV